MYESIKDRKETHAIISGYPRVAKSTRVTVIFHPTRRVPGTRFSPSHKHIFMPPKGGI